MTNFAKLLQLAGLVIVPMGLFIGLTSEDGHAEATELTVLGIGGFLFLFGSLLLRTKR